MKAALFFVFALSLFIDGATDCANSVTGAVGSGVLKIKSAVRMSGALTALGCMICGIFLPFVAENTAFCVTFFERSAPSAALISLLTVSLWSGAAWFLGLPTSEGHGLICAMGGAALALGGEIQGEAFLWIVLSSVPVAAVSAVFSVISTRLFKKINGAPSFSIIGLSALSSFFHGAQDGQKFLALAISAGILENGGRVWAVIAAALFMGVGTLFGERIIRKMGFEMVDATPRAVFSSDVGSTAALALFTMLGVPASTTHVRMVSLAAAVKSWGERADRGTLSVLLSAWIATFPVCFGTAYLLSKALICVNL